MVDECGVVYVMGILIDFVVGGVEYECVVVVVEGCVSDCGEEFVIEKIVFVIVGEGFCEFE